MKSKIAENLKINQVSEYENGLEEPKNVTKIVVDSSQQNFWLKLW